MQNTVFVNTYEEPEFNIKEILRYAGAKEGQSETEALILDCIKELNGKLTYKVCYAKFKVTQNDNILDLSFAKTTSKDLKKNLKSCKNIVLFAATIGIEIDRLIKKYSRISPLRALIFQAIGAERIESLCDKFCSDIKEEEKNLGNFTLPRFSPGYGDFPLDFQKEIFAFLDCPRKIGLTLNSSLVMSPSKSVTAIIGISDCDYINTTNSACKICTKANCDYRRTL